ncbi:unnamed protein product [Durusdinium trenchii]|uniref:Uncharacterized protein n=1 Tax=Durusdinium trenchii TaxID=1381693 RepID=A0ABP0PYV7_9DINO
MWSRAAKARSARSGWSFGRGSLLVALLALQYASLSFCRLPLLHRRTRLARHASFDRERLNNEATFAEGLVRSFEGFFQPDEPQLSPEEQEAQDRQQASSEATAQALQSLRLNVQAGEDDEGLPLLRAAPVSVLQSKAKQSVVIFAVPVGKEQLITDVLLSMRIEAKGFSERNVLVAPAIVDLTSRRLVELPPNIRASKLLRQKPIALPLETSGEETATWGEVLSAEFEEAELQGTNEVMEMGLAVIVGREGDILRRGFGRPSWKALR